MISLLKNIILDQEFTESEGFANSIFGLVNSIDTYKLSINSEERGNYRAIKLKYRIILFSSRIIILSDTAYIRIFRYFW